jgi:Lipocalin-like domain
MYDSVRLSLDGKPEPLLPCGSGQKVGENPVTSAAQRRSLEEAIVDTVREPLVVLDDALRVVVGSRSFYRAFQTTPEETEGRLLYELGDGQWNIPALRKLLEDIIPLHATIEAYEVEADLPGAMFQTLPSPGGTTKPLFITIPPCWSLSIRRPTCHSNSACTSGVVGNSERIACRAALIDYLHKKIREANVMRRTRFSIFLPLLIAIMGQAKIGLADPTLKEQLAGPWHLVSIHVERDGQRIAPYGSNPIGMILIDPSGYYSAQTIKAGRPKFASNSRETGTAEENQAAVQGTLTTFGTYAVNEADRSVTVKITGRAFQIGMGPSRSASLKLKGMS